MSNITAQNLQLMKQKTSSERRTEELTRERDQLNWTIGVIMEYQEFSVEKHCPQKGEHVLVSYNIMSLFTHFTQTSFYLKVSCLKRFKNISCAL